MTNRPAPRKAPGPSVAITNDLEFKYVAAQAKLQQIREIISEQGVDIYKVLKIERILNDD